MTSNILSSKLWKEDLKRRVWSIALCSTTFLFFIITFVLRFQGQIHQMNEQTATLSDMYNFINGFLGPTNKIPVGIGIISSVIIGVQGFSYLFSSDKVDLYHSLPIKRNTLFTTIYLNGMLIYIIPYTISVLVCSSLGAGNGYITSSMVKWVALGVFVHILGFLLCYNFTILAVMLTGNVIVAILGASVFYSYIPIIIIPVIQAYSDRFLETYYANNHFDTLLSFFSPVSIYYYLSGNVLNNMTQWHLLDHVPYMIGAIVWFILLLLLVLWLYQHRPSESAGRSMVFCKTEPVIRFAIVVPLSLLCGMFFSSLSVNESNAWLIFGIVLGVIIIHGAIEVIYQFNIRGAISHRKQLYFSIFLSLFCLAFFWLDMLGYDSFFPKYKELNSISIAVNNLDVSVNYDDVLGNKNSEDYILSQMRLTGKDMERAYSFLDNAIDTPAPKDKQTSHFTAPVTVAYHMGKHHTVYRSYMIDITEQQALFDLLYTSSNYKTAVFPIYPLSEQTPTEITWTNGIESLQLALTDVQREDLTNRYLKDFSSLSASTLAHETPIGSLDFQFVSDTLMSNAKNFSQPENHNVYYIYSNFEDTISFLSSIGIPVHKTILDYDIMELSSSYTPEVPDTMKEDVYLDPIFQIETDSNIINEMKSSFVPTELTSSNQSIYPYNWNWEFTLQIRNSEGQSSHRVTCVTTNPKLAKKLLLK
ncbi:DUF6449 domain-containing protein [Lachnospiraceae bacterium LCP25S3_G4]